MNNFLNYSSVCAPPHARPSQSHLHGLDLFIVSVVSGTPGWTILGLGLMTLCSRCGRPLLLCVVSGWHMGEEGIGSDCKGNLR